MIKRISLFLITNIAVMFTISLLINVLGVRPYLSANGIDYGALMVFCLIWGGVGSLISLLISKWSAKMMMGVKVISPTAPGEYLWLVNMVEQISRSANLPKTPEVGIYESPEVNAFATGPSKSNSLVAFSTGILQSMNRSEIEGVAAHEVAHIANGDMVTMTLIQGVVNAFVMFFARIIGFAISQQVEEEKRPMVRMFVTLALDIVLGLLGAMVTAWFSRQREFRADAGSARYVGREKMIAGLKNLQRRYGHFEDERGQAIASLKISGKSGGLLALIATHPPLEQRIAALQGVPLQASQLGQAA